MRNIKDIKVDGIELSFILAEHELWLMNKGGKHANLEGANLDFSCMPLWCGDLEAKLR